MQAKVIGHESRRSTRVPLTIVVTVDGGANLKGEGETVVVNLHGALISTELRLSIGMRISIHVYLTDKHAQARVVYADLQNPSLCGIELDEPRNIWGVSLLPDDWDELATSGER
jgi:hypothetical protein